MAARGGPSPDEQAWRSSHLLALPEGVAPDEVAWLAAGRFGGSRWDDEAARAAGVAGSSSSGGPGSSSSGGPPRALRLGRRSRLVGPFSLDEAGALVFGLPAVARSLWRLDCPPERGDPPWPGGGDRDGLGRAFPQGMPVREEERAVSWLVAVARRLRGSVRIAGSNVVLTPDPEGAIDLTVLADRWLEPAETLALVRQVSPAARPSGPGPDEHWAGPLATADPRARAALGRYGVRDETERARLAAEAAAYDAHVRAHPPDEHGYGVEADLGLDGMLVVEAEERAVLPPGIAGQAWTAGGVVAYRVHWEPDDLADLESEKPPFGLRVARGRAAVRVRGIARRLHAAVGGEVVDEAELPVRPSTL